MFKKEITIRMSRIIEAKIQKEPENPDELVKQFEGITNRIVEPENGEPEYIRIKHKGTFYRVDIATTPQDFQITEALHNEAFSGSSHVTVDELQHISEHGKVLLLLDKKGNLVAASGIITEPTPEHPHVKTEEVYCCGTAVWPGEEGKGYAQVLFKAQEVIARKQLYTVTEAQDPETGQPKYEYTFNKTQLTLTVRPENVRAIRARLGMGFRIVGYDTDTTGFIMEKSLHTEPIPSIETKQIQRVVEGKTEIADDTNVENMLTGQPLDIAVKIRPGNSIDLTAQQLSERILQAGYTGIGILRPEEYGDPDQSLLIFQRKDRYAEVEPLTKPPHVKNDYGRLREVILSYPPVTAILKPGDMQTLINPVARANALNYDSVATYDEHKALSDALEAAGVHVVRTHAFPIEDKEGRFPLFTRDPAVVLGNTFIVGKMGRSARSYETKSMRELSSECTHFYVEESEDKEAVVEGGDIIPLSENFVLVGLGDRTNVTGFKLLEKTFPNINFLGVPHGDLHLDVLFTVLGEKKVLADVTRLPPELIQLLRELDYEIVIAAPEEQKPLGCNVLAIDNNKVIAVKENPITNRRLREAGVEVIEVSMPNLIKKGGGPRCLTCPTYRD
jgi:N-dimethylarginine dimethylaminohydrolase